MAQSNEVLAEHSLAVRTAEERRAMAVKAGKASGIARRRQHEITDIYGHWLATQHDVDMYDEAGKPIVQKMSGAALINYVMGKIIQKGNKESVMMIAEIRKAREGTTYHIDNGAVDQDLEAASAEVLRAELEAEIVKRDKILQARKAGETVVPEDSAPGQEIGYEVETPEGASAVPSMGQGEAPEPTMQEVVKDDDTTQP